MTRPIVIDTHMHGRPGITGVFVVAGERTALIETGPKSSLEHVRKGLADAGVDSLDVIVVTHIHLDHAGAAGSLLREFPDAQVAVHGVGAPHLADPAKLWSSASRIYGDAMEQLWGGIDPIPEDKLRILEDGDVIDLGGRTLTAIETPGHAGHHHAFLDSGSGALFTGDALGVRLPEVGRMRPATPPPEFNLPKAVASIERLRTAGAEDLYLTHFGPASEGRTPSSVDETCDRSIEALNQWAEWIRTARGSTTDIDEVTDIVRTKAEEAMSGELDDDARDRMEQTTSYRMNTWGYMRYFDKQES